MKSTDRQQFLFLPSAFSRENAVIHSSCYHLAQLILQRSTLAHLIVPIENMQYLAIVEPNAFWFCHHEDQTLLHNVTGRMINLSWHPHLAESRDRQTQHIPMEVIYYKKDQKAVQRQLTGEFYKALMLLNKKHEDKMILTESIKIIEIDD